MAVSVLWFRRDLRLLDLPALAAAHSAGEVVPLFVVDPRFTATAGAPRRAYLARALQALDDELGGTLVYRHGDPADIVPTLAAQVGAEHVYVSRDYGPYGRSRDAAVAERLAEAGRRLHGVGSPYAVDPGSVLKGDGHPYAVFTPFSKVWRSLAQERLSRRPATPPVGAVSWRGAPDVACDGPPVEPNVAAQLPGATAADAHDQWASFMANGLDRYDDQRDLPAVAGTSRLSPALRWGTIHPAQLLEDLGDSRAHDVFRSELCWREFYADVLARRPETARVNLNPKMDTMPVDTDDAASRRFERWAAGMTGYPIVDAGMRQLLSTGWMHNRVRMITASFLVKDLHLPWQWGARHFMRHLVDGDLASNQHGWQWVAGTGTDAAPYFRIFNPTSQSERFDPAGDYIRQWVPELAGLRGSAVHSPGVLRPVEYPSPMVEHAAERDEAMRRYRSVTGASR